MDIELLRTFLEVARTRHFGNTAENLHLTQSAVSARIRSLEETVGVVLFDRARNNIRLTASGKRLLQHAEGIVTLWQRARQQVAVDDDIEHFLSISGSASVWDIFLQDWLEKIFFERKDLYVQADTHGVEAQLNMLREGSLDAAFTFETPRVGGFQVRQVAQIPLLMVSTAPDRTAHSALRGDYVLVDWGTSFANAHARFFPDAPPPRLRVGLGRIAHALLLKHGGCAYLAEPMVREELAGSSLFAVPEAPVINREAYVVYREDSDRTPLLMSLLQELIGIHGDSR
ncbi:MAG: LysR family transcriptional regulator [Hyphomicrobiales bacterium]|jgi:DNA-binding transcriptional LysR family regulator|nr:LysR family transcriptional regulator [Hyphomicrobiales bacterium]